MRCAAAALVVIAATACATGGRAPPARAGARPAAAAPDTTPLTLRVPQAVGAFALGGRRDFEDPSLGTQLRYVGPDSLGLDAYVYPAHPALARCGAACGDSAVQAEAAGFVELIPEYLRRGYFGTATVAADEALRPSAADAWTAGRHVALAATREGRPVRSDYYLYLLRGYRVKVRATYPDSPAAQASVRRFADELVRQLSGNRAADR